MSESEERKGKKVVVLIEFEPSVKVVHVTDGEKTGIVLDWKVSASCKWTVYAVAWNDGVTDWHYGHELKEDDDSIQF